jgi:RES domain-containing protein
VSLGAWRIVKERFTEEAFQGEGARRYGGRWNSPGTAVVYTAEHASLAVLEVLVHLETSRALAAYVLIKVEFDQALVEAVAMERLPGDWRSEPPSAEARAVGDEWVVEGRTLALKVPSAILPQEDVYVFNPEHPDFHLLEIHEPAPFFFDQRLLR